MKFLRYVLTITVIAGAGMPTAGLFAMSELSPIDRLRTAFSNGKHEDAERILTSICSIKIRPGMTGEQVRNIQNNQSRACAVVHGLPDGTDQKNRLLRIIDGFLPSAVDRDRKEDAEHKVSAAADSDRKNLAAKKIIAVNKTVEEVEKAVRVLPARRLACLDKAEKSLKDPFFAGHFNADDYNALLNRIRKMRELLQSEAPLPAAARDYELKRDQDEKSVRAARDRQDAEDRAAAQAVHDEDLKAAAAARQEPVVAPGQYAELGQPEALLPEADVEGDHGIAQALQAQENAAAQRRVPQGQVVEPGIDDEDPALADALRASLQPQAPPLSEEEQLALEISAREAEEQQLPPARQPAPVAVVPAQPPVAPRLVFPGQAQHLDAAPAPAPAVEPVVVAPLLDQGIQGPAASVKSWLKNNWFTMTAVAAVATITAFWFFRKS